MSDAERTKFWTQHAIGSEADREYLAACAQAQISMALSLERIAEALEKKPEFHVGFWENTKPIENPDMQHSTEGFASPVGDTAPDPVAADPFDCLCGQCGIEFKAPLHDEKYGSHKFEPSPYKDIKEWRKANNVSQVLPNVE